MPITRVGLVAKTGLDAAAGALAELAGWLEARDVARGVRDQTAALAGLPPGRPTVSRGRTAAGLRSVVVLGGDGTLIGMADRIARSRRGRPDPRRELRQPGFPDRDHARRALPALEAVLAGTAQIDERMMLRVAHAARRRRHADRLALNDVVITKGALSRIIELVSGDRRGP